MDKPAIMLVAESQALCAHLNEYLLCREFEFVEAPDQATARRLSGLRDFALVLIDCVSETAWNGLDFARQIRATDRSIPLILIIRQSSEASAIAALKLGVNDYFTWPVDYDELFNSIKRNLKIPQASSENTQSPAQQLCPGHVLVGNSPAMQHVRAYVSTVGDTDSTVLITGQTGTGKECVARQIHQCSPRCNKPLVCINCAALPDSLLESELFGFERGAFTGADAARLIRASSNSPKAAVCFLMKSGI